MAWTVRIMALEFMDSSGSGYTSDAVTCINYMTWEKVHYGVNVVAANNSWGGDGYSQTLRDAIAAAGDAGIVFVCSAGNGGSDDIGDDNDTDAAVPGLLRLLQHHRGGRDRRQRRPRFVLQLGSPRSVDLAAPGSAS